MQQKNTTEKPVIINELNIRSVDRGKKDIASWRSALRCAEAVQTRDRVRLYDLYEDVILDGHLSGIISKRVDAVLNKDIFFEINGKRQHSIDALIHSLPFRNMVRALLETRMWGITGIEFIPGNVFSFRMLPRKHIQPQGGIISYEQGGTEGVPYGPLSNVWVMGDPADLGLLLRCAPYALYKRGGMADWAEFVELFGQPVRVIKYDSYDEQTKMELRQVLEESGSSLSLMIPREADFEIMDGKRANSDGSLQLSFIKALNEEMSIIILGNTETTSSSYSSGYAQSKIHLEQQYEITRSDIAYVTALLNDPRFLNVLRAYGYPVQHGAFLCSKDMDIDYLTKRMAIDRELAQIVAIPDTYWYDTYGITNTNA